MKFTTIANARKQTGLSYLGSINSSAKMIKNQKVSDNYTYILYLAPAKTSGYEVCSHSTIECRRGCLNTSGRAAVEIYSSRSVIKDARIKKTRLFFEHQEFFMEWVIAEMLMYQRKAKKDGFYFSARLNGTSDIDWQNVRYKGLTIFEIFPEVAFYDYTKNSNKYINKPANYHLTFSYTGRNESKCKLLLERGFNIAVVFNVHDANNLPKTLWGYEVINGDLTDLRTSDPSPCIVGLKFKRIADKKVMKEVTKSMFVIQPNDIRCNEHIIINVQQ